MRMEKSKIKRKGSSFGELKNFLKRNEYKGMKHNDGVKLKYKKVASPLMFLIPLFPVVLNSLNYSPGTKEVGNCVNKKNGHE